MPAIRNRRTCVPEACPSPTSCKSHVRVWYEPMFLVTSVSIQLWPFQDCLKLCSFSFSVFLFWIQTLKFWTIKQILGKLYGLWENPCFRILSINLIFNKVIWPITLLNYRKSSVLFTEYSHFLLNSPLYHLGFII